ncbi:MAG: DUF5106 domain-containing protein [Bacteroidales bacterium]|nr:DUF5106 domain-containing protein [Bacteroidales bacterium]
MSVELFFTRRFFLLRKKCIFVVGMIKKMMMRTARYFLLVIIMMVWYVMIAQEKKFALPSVPGMLTEPTDRANYLAVHYWENFNFGDKKLIGNADVTEQGFSNFLSIMPYVTKKDEAFAKMYDGASVNSEMLVYFIDLTSKYLYEAESPLYDEELYIVALNQLLVSPNVPTEEKERLRYALATSMKNRVGHKAANFSYVMKGGKRGTLYTVKSDYILIYFNDPSCDGCKKMKEEMISSPAINKAIDDGVLKVLSVCVEGVKEQWQVQTLPIEWIDACDESMTITNRELYDLPSLPVLYLLDRSYRVVQKNTDIKKLEVFLTKKSRGR